MFCSKKKKPKKNPQCALVSELKLQSLKRKKAFYSNSLFNLTIKVKLERTVAPNGEEKKKEPWIVFVAGDICARNIKFQRRHDHGEWH